MSTNLQSWIVTDNFAPFMTALSWLCDAQLTETEIARVVRRLNETDESLNSWYELTMSGQFAIELSIARDLPKERLTLQIHSTKSIDQAVQAILGLAQHYLFHKISRPSK